MATVFVQDADNRLFRNEIANSCFRLRRTNQTAKTIIPYYNDLYNWQKDHATCYNYAC